MLQSIFVGQGYLEKRGGMNTSWKRRYFQMQGPQLVYFESELDVDGVGREIKGMQPLGTIPLINATMELDDKDTKPEKSRFAFTIKPTEGDRVYILGADSEATRREWLKILRLASTGDYDKNSRKARIAEQESGCESKIEVYPNKLSIFRMREKSGIPASNASSSVKINREHRSTQSKPIKQQSGDDERAGNGRTRSRSDASLTTVPELVSHSPLAGVAAAKRADVIESGAMQAPDQVESSSSEANLANANAGAASLSLQSTRSADTATSPSRMFRNESMVSDGRSATTVDGANASDGGGDKGCLSDASAPLQVMDKDLQNPKPTKSLFANGLTFPALSILQRKSMSALSATSRGGNKGGKGRVTYNSLPRHLLHKICMTEVNDRAAVGRRLSKKEGSDDAAAAVAATSMQVQSSSITDAADLESRAGPSSVVGPQALKGWEDDSSEDSESDPEITAQVQCVRSALLALKSTIYRVHARKQQLKHQRKKSEKSDSSGDWGEAVCVSADGDAAAAAAVVADRAEGSPRDRMCCSRHSSGAVADETDQLISLDVECHYRKQTTRLTRQTLAGVGTTYMEDIVEFHWDLLRHVDKTHWHIVKSMFAVDRYLDRFLPQLSRGLAVSHDSLGAALVRIGELCGTTLVLIRALIQREVEDTKNKNELFRVNSLASKVLTYFARIEGNDYLSGTLSACVRAIVLNENTVTGASMTFEIDPRRMHVRLGDDEDFAVSVPDSVEKERLFSRQVQAQICEEQRETRRLLSSFVEYGLADKAQLSDRDLSSPRHLGRQGEGHEDFEMSVNPLSLSRTAVLAEARGGAGAGARTETEEKKLETVHGITSESVKTSPSASAPSIQPQTDNIAQRQLQSPTTASSSFSFSSSSSSSSSSSPSLADSAVDDEDEATWHPSPPPEDNDEDTMELDGIQAWATAIDDEDAPPPPPPLDLCVSVPPPPPLPHRSSLGILPEEGNGTVPPPPPQTDDHIEMISMQPPLSPPPLSSSSSSSSSSPSSSSSSLPSSSSSSSTSSSLSSSSSAAARVDDTAVNLLHMLSIKRNKADLEDAVTAVVDAVARSIHNAPRRLRIVAYMLRCLVARKFPGNALSAVGGFFFLRFICPALLNPQAWCVHAQTQLSGTAQRNLLLLTKVLQVLSNQTSFTAKELHMQILNPYLDENREKVKDFFIAFSSPTNPHISVTSQAQASSEEFAFRVDKVKRHLDVLNRAVFSGKSEPSGSLRNGGNVGGDRDGSRYAGLTPDLVAILPKSVTEDPHSKAAAVLGLRNRSSTSSIGVPGIAAVPSEQTSTLKLNMLRAVWQADEDAPSCTLCRKGWTLRRRRHHCRSCGGIFCARCSGFQSTVPHFSIKETVRVCAICFEKIKVTLLEDDVAGSSVTMNIKKKANKLEKLLGLGVNQ